MSLYHSYRPQIFSEVIGQGHVVTSLIGGIKSEHIGHAYIFAGPRGTGKTSVARIFTKAVNCLSIKDGHPCGRCENCVSIAEGNFLDLIEIDGASNRSIDDIRDLKEKVRFAPSKGARKVYIIDEVHMLTKEAFNALLKTLEEPPVHVIFVMATTEIYKIPATILSRCQRFDFRKITLGDITKTLEKIAEKEKIDIDEEALKMIASLGEGSMRDSLSFLDQIRSFYGKEKITTSAIENILGMAQKDQIAILLDSIFVGEIDQGIKFAESLYASGLDIDILIKSVIRLLHEMLQAKINPEISEKNIASVVAQNIVKKQSLDDMVLVAEIFNEAIKNNKYSFLPQLSLNLAIIKSAKFFSKIPIVQDDTPKTDNIPMSADSYQSTSEEKKIVLDKDKKESFLDKVKKEKISLLMILQNAQIEEKETSVEIGVDNDFYFSCLNEAKNIDFLQNTIMDIFGKNKKLLIKKISTIVKESDDVADALSILGGEIIE